MSRDEVLGDRGSLSIQTSERISQPKCGSTPVRQAGNSNHSQRWSVGVEADPGQILRVTVPRRAPASVPEQELWVLYTQVELPSRRP